MENLKHIIESLLFVAEEPLSVDRLKKIIPTVEGTEIKNALITLSDDYETRGGGFYLKQVAGGFQIRTRQEYTEWIKRLIQPNPPKLSKAALETLAIIAYKQPIIRSDIEHIRGVDCGGVIRVLMERKLVRILGRKEIPGRPLIYATTKRFLEVFDLKDLKELPSPKEIEEFGDTEHMDSEFENRSEETQHNDDVNPSGSGMIDESTENDTSTKPAEITNNSDHTANDNGNNS